MADWVLLLTAILVLFAWFYWKLVKPLRFWSDLGVPGPAPTLFLGNIRQVLNENRSQSDLRLSRQYGSMYGFYLLSTPQLMITDAALIKQILVKDFRLFVNRQKLFTYHEMWNENLFNAEGEKWRTIRSITSPAFTSGKLKSMHALIHRCIDNLVAHLDKATTEKGGVIEDAKQFCAGFAIDVIAGTSFATQTNANSAPDSPLVVNAKVLFQVHPFRGLLAFASPSFLSRLLGVRGLFPPKPFQYFIDLTREIVRQRKAGKDRRNDLVQLMMDSSVDETELTSGENYQKLTATAEETKEEQRSAINSSSGVKKTLTEDEIVAQCLLFLTAGFETTSLTLFHTAYELAKHPQIQEKLHSVIVESTAGLSESSDDYSDLVINQIDYLEATIKETLRRYPPITSLFRRVSAEGVTLAGVPLPKDLGIDISCYAVHHNPEYYPEPEVFKPERFLPENKHHLVPYTYLPFGDGPRNCIGQRFAYQELKLVLAKLMTRYRFETTPQTPDKPTFFKGIPLLVTETFPLKVVKRK